MLSEWEAERRMIAASKKMKALAVAALWPASWSYRLVAAQRWLMKALAGTVLLLAAGAGAGHTFAQGADPNVIPMQDRQFTVPEITVPAGTTLTWVNLDGEEHDVISDDSSVLSPIIEPGQSWSFTFTVPGTFHYICDLHANMEGTVIVVDGAVAPAESAPAAVADTPPDAAPAESAPAAMVDTPPDQASRAAGL